MGAGTGYSRPSASESSRDEAPLLALQARRSLRVSSLNVNMASHADGPRFSKLNRLNRLTPVLVLLCVR